MELRIPKICEAPEKLGSDWGKQFQWLFLVERSNFTIECDHPERLCFQGEPGLYELILPSDLSTISSVWTCADMTNLRKIVVLGINKFSFEKFGQIGTDVEIVTWGGTAIASAAGNRFVDLATVNYTGSDVLLTSSASGTTISLTPTPATNQEFAITYLTGTTESATVNTANKIFTLPSVGFIGCISYAVWTDTLESMITDVRTALNALAVTTTRRLQISKHRLRRRLIMLLLRSLGNSRFSNFRAVNGAIVRVDGVEKGRSRCTGWVGVRDIDPDRWGRIGRYRF